MIATAAAKIAAATCSLPSGAPAMSRAPTTSAAKNAYRWKTPRRRGRGRGPCGSAEDVPPGARTDRALARDRSDGRRLRALLALAWLELDPGALVEALVALAGDLRVMDEQILSALVRRDEPVALRSVEPLDGTGSHGNTSLTTHERVKKAPGLRHRYSFLFAASVAGYNFGDDRGQAGP